MSYLNPISWEELKKRKKQMEMLNYGGATDLTDDLLDIRVEEVQEDDDIAPVATKDDDDDDSGWFKSSGVFDDGYDFGDITKTIIGSTADLSEGISAGILGIGEKVVDAGAYLVGGVGGLFGADEFKEDMQDFIAKDLYDEREVAKYVNPLAPLTPIANEILGIDTEEDSIFGDKTDSLAQSGGELLGTVALQAVGVPWFLTTGVTSFGGAVEGASLEGASYEEAGLYGAITMGAEILTEKLFGGSGLGEKGLINLDGITKGISSKVVKTLADVGVDMAAEGTEEVVSSIFTRLGSSLYKEENLGEILASEEAFEEYLDSFIGGAVLGGVMNTGKSVKSIKTGRDYRTGLTENEQKVFDKVYNESLAQAEKNGKELTKKQKDALYDQVMEGLRKGYVSTDTIEEMFGGEDYKAYKSILDKEQPLRDRIKSIKQNDTLTDDEKQTLIKDIEAQLETLATETNKAEVEEKLGKTMASQLSRQKGKRTLTDDYLLESYNEKARTGQKFKVDLSKVKDEKVRENLKSIMDSGIVNNTRGAHEFWEYTARVSADRGHKIIPTTTADILKMETEAHGAEYVKEHFTGVTPNGYRLADGTIAINVESPNSRRWILGHEIGHSMEKLSEYGTLRDLLYSYAETKEGKDAFGKRKGDIKTRYEGVKGADADVELTNDLIGEYLYNDKDFIYHLSTKDRNLFQRLWDEVKYLYKMATAGSQEQRDLLRIQKTFEKAYRESVKAQTKTKDKTDYSLSLVDPVLPTTEGWHRTHTTEEVKEQFPELWDVSAEDSEVRNPTQISGTVRSYRKVYEHLKAEGFDGTILDASSGLGYGTKAGIEEYGFDVEDIEPYPDKSYNPKYTDYSALDKKYDVVISNAVLNVLPQDQRDALVVKMGEMLNDSGRIFINVRGDDVKNASSKVAIDEELMEYYIAQSGSYQKGFTPDELKAYLEDTLGDEFTVEKTRMFGKVSAIVTKNSGTKYSLSKSEANTQDGYADAFYSHMANVVDGIKQEKLGADSVVNMLRGKGVKAEEIKWSGIEAWLEGKKSVTTEELREFVANNQLEIEESVRQNNFEVVEDDDELVLLNGTEEIERFVWDEDEEAWKAEDGDSWFADEDEILSAAEADEGHSSTKWQEYKLDGGENYREIVFKLPNSSYTNIAMKGHWGENAEGVLAHARIQDMTTSDGKKMLFIEEIQSDWHNAGHKVGYKSDVTSADVEKLKEIESQISAIEDEMDAVEKERDAFLDRYWAENLSDLEYNREMRKYRNREYDLRQKQQRLYEERGEYKRKVDYAVPDAPFRDTYHEYVLKRLLRMGAEEGYDSIGWTTADIQTKRWSEDYAEGYRIEYDQDIPKFLRKYGKKWGATVGHSIIEDNIEGRYLYTDKATGAVYTIEEVFSKAEQIVETKYNEPVGMGDIEISLTGAVYVETESHNTYIAMEVTPSLGTKVWSMDITDSMKDSVLHEGQPKYSLSTEYTPMEKTVDSIDPTASNLQKDLKTVRAVRTETMLKNGYNADDVEEVNHFMDNLATFMEKAGVTYKFIGLEDVNNAKLKVTYDKNGNPKKITMSAMVKNGEYPVNFDFTRICKKRESMSMVIKELAKRKTADGRRTIDTINLNAEALWTINEELRKAGLETACLGCFVESKRYNIQAFADKAVKMWNTIVDEVRQENGAVGEAESFNFAEGINLDRVDYGAIEKIFADYKTVKGRTSPEARMRALIRNGGELYQRYLQPSDLMTPEGIESIKAMSTKKNDFYGILKGVYGQAAPKEVMGFSPYNSEVAMLPKKKNGKALSEYVASIGGVRMQSFSDFLVANTYDYMQMVADLSARHLPAHAYTKEIAFAKIFGMTGIKINMSVMFDIDANLPNEYAGLQFVADENGDEVYNGVKGYWDYLVGDKKRSDSVYEATGERPYVQSIGFDEAVALQNDPRYSKNCGIIGVGMSDRHILKMLDDGRIRYIIPYHSSSLPAVIAEVTNIKKATDYTNFQNTRRIVSVTDANGNAIDIKSLREQCNSWSEVYSLLQENVVLAGWEVQTESDEKLAGRGGFDIYKDLETTQNPKQSAENYLQYCAENNYMPVFEQFAFHENYYKLLYDFDPYDTVTGEYSPQTEVKNIYSGYNPSEGLTSTETVEKIINDEMAKQNEINKARNEVMPGVVDNVLEHLGVDHNEVGVSVGDSHSLSREGDTPIRFADESPYTDRYVAPTEDIAPMREDVAKNATTTPMIDDEEETIVPTEDVVEEDVAPTPTIDKAKAEKIRELLGKGKAEDVAPEPTLDRAKAQQIRELLGWSTKKAESATATDTARESVGGEQIKTVKERLNAKLQNIETELANNQRLRNESKTDFDKEIARLKAEYDAKKNKNTKVANDILRRIERLERIKGNVDADYEKRISDLEQKKAKVGEEVRKGQSAAEERTMRKELHRSIIDRIKAKFTEKGSDFDEVLRKAKDLSTFATVDNTPQRVMEKSLGYKEGQILADETVNKVAQNETEGIKWLNSFTDRNNGLLAKISKQYHIKPGSKESAATQMYAEGFYVDEDNNIIEYGDAELAKDFPNADVRKNIKRLAKDSRIRKIYDDTLSAINESRVRNGYPEIPRLDNYFLHFRAMDDTFSRLGLPFNPNDIKAKDLPTDLNGVTADLKPGQPYFASAKHRTGKRTSFDLLGGLERYLSSAKNQIYHIDDIQTLRALRNYIADTYGQANGLDGLDALNEEEAQEKIKQVYGSHLSTFAKFLNEEANVIAGKTALIDRGLEGIIGRRGITLIDTINKQVGSNMVGFNISSSLTNFIAGVQAIAKTSKLACIKSLAQTTTSKVKSIFGVTDSFVENNPTLIRRQGAERFYRTPWQKFGDAGYVLMSAVDNVTTEFIVRAKYNEFISKGMSEAQAITEADKWTSRLMGDRSLGQQPQLFNSKMLGTLTKFQLEVRNQLDSQFYDTIKEAQASNADIKNGLARNAKTAAKVTTTLFELAVLQHLFGKAFESVAGYNPAFDIIEVLIKALGFDDDEESEDTALDNIEQGFLELIEDLPYTSTFTGGRIPISSALPIEELIKGKDEYGNDKSRLETLKETAPYYLLPTGYGQLKKTTQGLAMFDDDLPIAGSYTDSGNLRFPVEDTFGNRLQAGIFGQWANENARDYIDNERSSLKPKQIKEFIDSDMPIGDYWDYREGLSGLDTLEEKADYINSLDLTVEQKNILINNIANRNEDIDLSDYGEYEDFAEFDFAQNNSQKYALAKSVGGYTSYKKYKRQLNDIKADKDEDGKAISGSRKEKVIDYINNLYDADYGERIILYKSEYKADDTYNMEIVEYLNSREDLSYEEVVAILKELGFNVNSATGDVTWD